MAQAHHVKAAELHGAAAESHRKAAELHGKKDDKAGLEHSKKAEAQSAEAHKATGAAHGKSVGAPPPRFDDIKCGSRYRSRIYGIAHGRGSFAARGQTPGSRTAEA
jgi:hypothetical protein